MFRNRTDHHDHESKQEGISEPTLIIPATLSSSRTLRSTRTVPASGSKDRHSKVSTVRGLRDRRVRLSVTTAIRLYDLQDKLGVNQPSKAVDWLLNNARHEIDKLLPIEPPPWIHLPQPATVRYSRDRDISRYSSSATGNNEIFSRSQMEAIGTVNMNMGNCLYGSYDQWETGNENIMSGFHFSEVQNLQCQLGLNSTGLVMPYSTEPVCFPARLGHFQAGSSSHQHQY